MMTVNAMGDACPIPVVKTKKAMETLKAGDVVETYVDNEIAVENLCWNSEIKSAMPQQTESGVISERCREIFSCIKGVWYMGRTNRVCGKHGWKNC